jgi:hypothetical protein
VTIASDIDGTPTRVDTHSDNANEPRYESIEIDAPTTGTILHSFHWQLDGLDKPKFELLVNMVSNYQGSGQLKLKSTSFGNRGPIPKQRKLRMRFLDRFAELVSRDSRLEMVSCTMLREAEGTVKVWVSRNSGFDTEEDSKFFGEFERLMPNVQHSEEGLSSLFALGA